MGTFTLIIVLVTVLVSLMAFSNNNLSEKLLLWPYYMDKPGEYYRLLTNGLVHADGQHLFFNMFTLYFVGSSVEGYYRLLGMPMMYCVMYLLGIIVASLPSFFKHRNHSYYRSLGASGGVAAVLFSLVYFDPWGKILVMFIPMPSILFAVLYLVYSVYMSKRGNDYINHDAHFGGAVFGWAFTLLCDPTHGQIFFQQLLNR